MRQGGGNVLARVVKGAAQCILEYYGKDDLAKVIQYTTSEKDGFCMTQSNNLKSKYTVPDIAELRNLLYSQ